jgi:hypothetical protein
MGQAAGTAAAMTVTNRLESVRGVDMPALQSSLLEQNCILDPFVAMAPAPV